MKIRIKTLFVMAGIAGVVFLSFRDGESQGHQYESHGKRDPFAPLIGHGKLTATVGLEDVASIAEVKLEGIATSAKGRTTAILNGELMKEGDTIGIVRVLRISKNSVTLLMGGKEYTVELSTEEGGAKGG